MKKRYYLILLIILLIPFVVNAEEKDSVNNTNKSDEELLCEDENYTKYKCQVPKVDNSIKVFDYANLLTENEETTLSSMIENYISRYNMDMVLVTIDDNPYGVSDANSKKYAQDFYYYSGFGKNSSHDGSIILIDMSNRYIYIATKGNAIRIFDDNRIDNITEAGFSYLRNKYYYDGYRAMIEKSSYYASEGVSPYNINLCIDEDGEPYNCVKVPTVDNKEKIYDYANILTEDEKNTLVEEVGDFIENYKLDVVLITLEDNPYGDIPYYTEIYAKTFYEHNNFGLRNNKSGIVMIVDKKNKYNYMAAYGDALLIFDQERIKNITEVGRERVQTELFYSSLSSMMNKLNDYAKDGILEKYELYCAKEDGTIYQCREEPKKPKWLDALIIGTGASLLIAFVHTRKYRGIKLATNANSYLKTTSIDKTVDQFLTTFTSRIRRSHDSGGSGGGHSGGFGGSSTSHGSGGSFGGGGRHF